MNIWIKRGMIFPPDNERKEDMEFKNSAIHEAKYKSTI